MNRDPQPLDAPPGAVPGDLNGLSGLVPRHPRAPRPLRPDPHGGESSPAEGQGGAPARETRSEAARHRRRARSGFRAAWWLSSPHLQTVWPTLFRPAPPVALTRERLELDDGDFIDLDWTTRPSGPRLLVLHGLEGCSRSHYVRGLSAVMHGMGWRVIAMHYRGCSGEPNRLSRTYHSGETSDLGRVVRELRRREAHAPLCVVGYSLGGNVVLKWLGERGNAAEVDAAVAVSVPFLLDVAAERLTRGLSRFYQWYLLRLMRRKVTEKFRRWDPAPIDISRPRSWRTMSAFDDAVTAPLHGFRDALDYYQRASARRYLGTIATPTLILHARDDPLMSEAVIPDPEELSESTRLELSEKGGHVGFIGGSSPAEAEYWLERRIPEFLNAQVALARA